MKDERGHGDTGTRRHGDTGIVTVKTFPITEPRPAFSSPVKHPRVAQSPCLRVFFHPSSFILHPFFL